MKTKALVLSVTLVAGLSTYAPNVMSAQQAEVKPKGVKPGVISALALNKEGTYCNLKFPAIEVNTLSSKTPKLKSASAGDIIDYYGPCDHDPVGYEEVCRQRVRESRTQFCD